MTPPSANHLGKARIRQLLAAVGTAPVPERTPENLTVYDWRDPHCLNADQLNRLAAVMSQVAARWANVLTRYFNKEFDVSPTAITQHFAGDLRRIMELDHDYCLTFGREEGPACGFLAIPPQTTMGWVTRLLGDTESGDDSDRPLSSLEESLLSDLVTAILDIFLGSLRPHETFASVGRLSKGQPSIQFERTDEVCRLSFRIRETGQEDPADITFLLPCDALVKLVGKTPAATGSRATPLELSQALMEHLHRMTVTVTARLASATIGFQEILDLAPGDVLLLDQPTHALVELAIEGRTAFRGRPARSDGKYAILIKEARTGPTPEPRTPKTSSPPKKG